VHTAMRLPDSELPVSQRRRDPPQLPALAQLLAVVVNGLAAECHVDPALLAPMDDLKEVVRWRLGVADAGEEPFILQGWRGEIIRETLLELLDGKRSVRVASLEEANPLVVER